MVHSVEGISLIKELLLYVDGRLHKAIPFYEISGAYFSLEGDRSSFSFRVAGVAHSQLVRPARYPQDLLVKDHVLLVSEQSGALGAVTFSVIAESLLREQARTSRPPHEQLLEGLSDYPRKKNLLKDRHLFSSVLEDLKRGVSWSDKAYPRLECPATACLEPEWQELSKVSIPRLKSIFNDMFRGELRKEMRLCWSNVYKHFSN